MSMIFGWKSVPLRIGDERCDIMYGASTISIDVDSGHYGSYELALGQSR